MKKLNYDNVWAWLVGLMAFTVFTTKKVIQLIDAEKQKFRDQLMPIAKRIEQETGIKPIITITQSAHESAWGKSGLTQKANNLFGFTGESWESAGKPVIKLPTKEYINDKWITVNRPFRAYPSWDASVRDWSALISNTPRYSLAFAAARLGDVNKFATEVSRAGYATDPNYAIQLVAISKVVVALPPTGVANV